MQDLPSSFGVYAAKKSGKYTAIYLLVGLLSMALWVERDFVSALGYYGVFFAILASILGMYTLVISYIAFNVFAFHAVPLVIAVLSARYRSLGRFVMFVLWASNPLVLLYIVSDVTFDPKAFAEYLDWHGYFVIKIFVIGVAAFIGAKQWFADYSASNLEVIQPYLLIVPISLLVSAAISPDYSDSRRVSGISEPLAYYVGTVLFSSFGYWLGSVVKRIRVSQS